MVTIKLTLGEALLLKRLRSGLTQEQMAAKLREDYDTYRARERGELEQGHRPQLGPVHVREACMVQRKRSKKTQKEIAKQIGVSRVWVHRMERGLAPVRALADFWGLR